MRAQAHTLEGVAAALLVVATVAFTIQATAVTPLTASTASQHIETQHERVASGLLATERANGNLSRTLRYWNGTGASFTDAGDDGYYVGEPPGASFLLAVEETFGDRAVAYNVNVHYVGEAGERRVRRLAYHGQPSADAVAATRLVTLYDDQPVTERDGAALVPTDETVADVDNAEGERYLAPNAPGHAYAVVEVEVVVWRT
ncbi:hypothetical protein [Halobacterium sp. CBA1126]|uniref:DUF7288 family protein n=1 Tax=Halobacterium sp. CBA1126 TaxID=2668074 RepID=UPI0012F78634|nr:hypothetical protein [Halobacterium sp. CBA1126]MUV61225.1 hypothetical protein [Halobacterium sp. CBA1126]